MAAAGCHSREPASRQSRDRRGISNETRSRRDGYDRDGSPGGAPRVRQTTSGGAREGGWREGRRVTREMVGCRIPARTTTTETMRSRLCEATPGCARNRHRAQSARWTGAHRAAARSSTCVASPVARLAASRRASAHWAAAGSTNWRAAKPIRRSLATGARCIGHNLRGGCPTGNDAPVHRCNRVEWS